MNVDLPLFFSSPHPPPAPAASTHHHHFFFTPPPSHPSDSLAQPSDFPPLHSSPLLLDTLQSPDSLLHVNHHHQNQQQEQQQQQQLPPPPTWLLHNAHLLPFLTNLVNGACSSNQRSCAASSSTPATLMPPDHLLLHHFPSTFDPIHPSPSPSPSPPLPPSSSVKHEAPPSYHGFDDDLLHPIASSYPRHDLDHFSSPSIAASALPAAAALRFSQVLPGSLDLQEQYLAELQTMLSSEYGVNLSMSQILDLAYDALPALTPSLGDYYHGAGDHPPPPLQPHEMNLHQLLEQQPSEEVQNPIRASSTASSSDVVGTSMLHDCRRPAILDYRAGSSTMAIPGLPKTTCLSEASSSALTENGEQSSIRQQKLLPPALVSTTTSSDSHELAAEGPANKRIKLQGITLEQVMAAEQQCLKATSAEKAAKPRSSAPAATAVAAVAAPAPAHDQRPIAAPSNGRVPVETNSKPTSSEKRVVSASMIASYSSVEPQSIAARNRRKRIREKTESLGQLIPGATRLDTAAMFDLAIKYVHFLQAQMVCLEREAEQKQKQSTNNMSSAGGGGAAAETSSLGSRALMHRLLSSPDIQHFLAREGYCLVSHGLAHSLVPRPSV